MNGLAIYSMHVSNHPRLPHCALAVWLRLPLVHSRESLTKNETRMSEVVFSCWFPKRLHSNEAYVFRYSFQNFTVVVLGCCFKLCKTWIRTFWQMRIVYVSTVQHGVHIVWTGRTSLTCNIFHPYCRREGGRREGGHMLLWNDCCCLTLGGHHVSRPWKSNTLPQGNIILTNRWSRNDTFSYVSIRK